MRLTPSPIDHCSSICTVCMICMWHTGSMCLSYLLISSLLDLSWNQEALWSLSRESYSHLHYYFFSFNSFFIFATSCDRFRSSAPPQDLLHSLSPDTTAPRKDANVMCQPPHFVVVVSLYILMLLLMLQHIAASFTYSVDNNVTCTMTMAGMDLHYDHLFHPAL